jgi:glycosyltransferase involved in cell wall biosynthesis
MATYKFKGAVSLASNSIGSSTGYGVQGKYLAEKLLKHGVKVANLSNYGLEGRVDTIRTKHGDVKHYPRGQVLYSEDVMQLWHKDFTKAFPELKSYLFTLYDVWVYNNLKFDGEIISWVPLDHITLPPLVAKFLLRDQVTPIAMSPHGKRQLDEAGIDSTYIPHAVDTKVFKPTDTYEGMPTREYLQVPEDAFLVSIVQANKANGQIHRKALAEQFLAFGMFRKQYPNSYLYLHMEPNKAFGGFDLPKLLKACGLDQSCVLMADSDILRTGYPQEFLSAVYTASDVLLGCSYGEGFGVPVVEAQACGTRVITSGFAATQDLAGPDSWIVGGQPFWDEAQQAFFSIPFVQSMVEALKEAHDAPKGASQEAITFAKQFDVDFVWDNYWKPFWSEKFS